MKKLLLVTLSAVVLTYIFPSTVLAATPTSANLKVAFIGDTGEGTNFQNVLNLIKAEGAEIVFHQGDHSYTTSPTTWANKVNTTIPNIIYIGSDGNHDDWTQYAPFYQQQITKHQSELTVTGTVASGNYAVVYKGLKFANIQEDGYTTFAKDQLQNADNIWKVCGWHKNQTAMQVGSKPDERGWQLYEDCRLAGALIMTGHEHSYERTKTLTNMTTQTIDSTCSSPTQECVSPGRTFTVVSGLGGREVRNQDRCLTGCPEWAKIYTSDQGATYGALFMIFNYQGNPNKAHGYFKNISGQIVDEFDVTSGSGSPIGGTTIAPTSITPTSISPTTPISITQPVGSNCAKKNIGNADCVTNSAGAAVDILDYAILYGELTKGCSNTNLAACGTDADHDGNVMDANFNYPGTNYIMTDTIVNSFDYAVWIQGYIAENPIKPTIPVTYSPTPTPSVIAGQPTLTPTAGSTSPVPTVPVGTPGKGLWISPQEIAALPASGAAWDRMHSAANGSFGSSALYNQDSDHPELTLAAAFVAAKKGPSEMCGSTSCQSKAIAGIMDIMDDTATTGGGDGRALALGRNLMAYVVAADVVNLRQVDPTKNATFLSFLKAVVNKQTTECGSLRECHSRRPNNWGAMTGASRIAADIYMGDTTDLATAYKIYKGYVGDRTSYSSFEFDPAASKYACDTALVPINPPNCVKAPPNCSKTYDLSGAVIDDVRRDLDDGTGSCPPNTHYAWGGFSAVVAQAELLYRAGMDSYNLQNKAILRGMQFLSNVMSTSASPPAEWMPWVVRKRYGSGSFSYTPKANGGGRLMDWSDWTHQ